MSVNRLSVVNQPAQPKSKKDKGQQADAAASKVNDALGAQGVVQDGSRLAVTASKGQRVVKAVSDIANGDKLAILNATSQATQGVSHASQALGLSNKAGAFAARMVGTTGKSLRLVGKVGPILSVPFTGLDVYNAIQEHDPKQKPAAWTNAALSVAGTAAGCVAVPLLATTAGLPLLCVSCGLGAFQLADAYMFKNKGTQWLADHVSSPIAHGVSKAWKALTGH